MTNRWILGLVSLAFSMTFVAATASADDKGKACSELFKLSLADEFERVGEGRYLLLLSDLESQLRKADSLEGLLDTKVASDIRVIFFQLEALNRKYKKFKAIKEDVSVESKFTEFSAAVGQFEDQFGRLVDSRAAIDKGQGIGLQQPQVDAEKRTAEDARIALIASISQYHLLDLATEHGFMARARKLMDKIDFPKRKKDSDKMFKEIAEEFREIEEWLKKEKYDFRNLQGNTGVHELRRNLRWAPITLIALAGQIKIVDRPSAVTPHLNVIPLSQFSEKLAKYAVFPVRMEIEKPCEISKDIIMSLNYFIQVLGDLKDAGEVVENVEAAYVASHPDTSAHDVHHMTTEFLAQRNVQTPDHHKATNEIAKQILKMGLLSAFADEVEACR